MWTCHDPQWLETTQVPNTELGQESRQWQQLPPFHAMDKEEIMQQWDYHRSRIAEDNWGGASEPRDWFESIIEWMYGLEQQLADLKAENERLRADIDKGNGDD